MKSGNDIHHHKNFVNKIYTIFFRMELKVYNIFLFLFLSNEHLF